MSPTSYQTALPRADLRLLLSSLLLTAISCDQQLYYQRILGLSIHAAITLITSLDEVSGVVQIILPGFLRGLQ